MKKLVILLSVCLLVSLFAGCGKKESGPKVRVSVTTGGTLQLAAKEVTVTDGDGDGTCTLLDAIRTAHEKYGSADKPFTAEDTEFGKSITSIWGDENGMSGYGVYQNNDMAYDLTTPVSEGDYIVAYSYADLETWSDTYAYFDKVTVDASNGSVTLNLSAVALDADWNPVKSPLAGAVITVDGAETEFVTDENGNVILTLSGKGEKVVSAVTDAYVLIPPVALVTVK